jgi:hypothetical protein
MRRNVKKVLAKFYELSQNYGTEQLNQSELMKKHQTWSKNLAASREFALGFVLAVALAIPAISNAQYDMTNSDSLGSTSFNTAGNWNSAAVPTAGSTYSTMGWLLRSPTTAGSYTFAGDELTVGGGSGAAAGGSAWLASSGTTTANNNALIIKASGVTLTVNNLILDGAQIRDGLGDNSTWAIDGNIFVTTNGGGFVAQSLGTINATISGPGPIYIGDQGNVGDTGRGIFFTSSLSTYTGNIYMNESVANRSRLTFTSGSVMNFTIGANGVNNGIFVNSQHGEFAGAFNINLTGADNTVGDTWDIVTTTTGGTSVYDGTFSVTGFTPNGTLWDESANGVDYEFNETTGDLTVVVPEPSTLALCGMGIAGLLAFKRRK